MSNIKWLIVLVGLIIYSGLAAQSTVRRPDDKTEIPFDWSYLDPGADSVPGISLYKAYKLLKGRTGQRVLVAVIDQGVDISHKALLGRVWTNHAEIPDNGIDDDQNGYVDDVHGWNFRGGKDGATLPNEQAEVTQIYLLWKNKYEKADTPVLNAAERQEWQMYTVAKNEFFRNKNKAEAARMVLTDTGRYFALLKSYSGYMQGKYFTAASLNAIHFEADSFSRSLDKVIADLLYRPYFKTYDEAVAGHIGAIRRIGLPTFMNFFADEPLRFAYNTNYNARALTGDDPFKPGERYYGSPLIRLEDGNNHGTHIAGIIAAERRDSVGIDGIDAITGTVEIMPVPAIPESGDERDKDVANAVRYAVDNGARVINLSFAKQFSPNKRFVDSAIRYAEGKGVLIFHAAANQAENNDSIDHFPLAKYSDGSRAWNFIEIGSTTFRFDERLVSGNSDYGRKTVDLFAPGSDIYSTIPGNKYGRMSGTSMASPCVAAVAALLFAYFPKLTAEQVKEIILHSCYKPDLKVRKPGTGELVPFSELSATGGIVNVYNAVSEAISITEKK